MAHKPLLLHICKFENLSYSEEILNNSRSIEKNLNPVTSGYDALLDAVLNILEKTVASKLLLNAVLNYCEVLGEFF